MNTIVVYKTDVDNILIANSILDEIKRASPGCDPSFDLEDCDNVLRVENEMGVDSSEIKKILNKHGYQMHVLL